MNDPIQVGQIRIWYDFISKGDMYFIITEIKENGTTIGRYFDINTTTLIRKNDGNNEYFPGSILASNLFIGEI